MGTVGYNRLDRLAIPWDVVVITQCGIVELRQEGIGISVTRREDDVVNPRDDCPVGEFNSAIRNVDRRRGKESLDFWNDGHVVGDTGEECGLRAFR